MRPVTVFLAIGIVIGVTIPHGFVSPLRWLMIVVILALGALLLRKARLHTTIVYASVLALGILLSSVSIEKNERKKVTHSNELMLISSPRLSKSGKVCMADAVTKEGNKVIASFLLNKGEGEKAKENDLPDMGEVVEVENNKLRIKVNKYYESQGYCGSVLLIPGKWKTVAKHDFHVGFTAMMTMFLADLRNKLLHNLGKDRMDVNEYAIVAAMTLGDKHSISDNLRSIYSHTGASHVLALSGMHIGILYSIMLWIAFGIYRLLARSAISYLQSSKPTRLKNKLLHIRPDHDDMKNVTSLIVVAFLWFYAMLVGMMPSVVRAVSMLSIYTLARCLNRDQNITNVLAQTAFIMLIISPMSLFDIGFQMSFLAVLGIAMFFSPINSFGKRVPHTTICKPIKWIWSCISLSLAAQILVFPLVLQYFGIIAFCSILTSIIVSVTALLIVCLAFMLLAVSGILSLTAAQSVSYFLFLPLSHLKDITATLLSVTVRLQNTLLEWIASLPYGCIDGLETNWIQTALTYIILICVAVIFFKIKKNEENVTHN